ncbi:MBL fold metallo-hydrolase [Candidatus Woesearchaeota archaeon]|nr:MBL fold metallo-hydrolase [Candidatus Woesearchaeota archaeon]
MGSRILFLGTAGHHAIYGTQVRASGGILLQGEGYQVHLDPGPGALLQLNNYKINVKEHTAVAVTHAHLNHCNDLNVMLGAMSYQGFDRHGILITNETVVNGDGKLTPVLTHAHRNFVERLIVLKPSQKVAIDEVEIHALPAFHSDSHALGFKLYTPEAIISYSGDTKYHKDLLEAYDKSDILILNVQHPFGAKEEEGLSSDDAVKILQKVKPVLCVITHFGPRMMKENPVYQAREIQKQTNVQVIAAEDGFELTPDSYAAISKQKRLTNFE